MGHPRQQRLGYIPADTELTPRPETLAAWEEIPEAGFQDFPLIRLARGVGMAAVNRIAPARRMFMQEAGGAFGELPRLLRGEAL